MSQAQIETYKIKAIKNVLGTFGENVFSIMKEVLYHEYKITLTENSLFTLEELQIALQRMLGESSADLIMRNIRSQIHELEKGRLH